MKDEEIKRFLKERMMEDAPENFTIKVMDVINKEAKTQSIISTYTLPAKGLLISMIILFVLSILWALTTNYSSSVDFEVMNKYIEFNAPTFEFNKLIFSNIVMYVCLAFLGFLFLDYFMSRNKNVRIA